MSIGWIGSTFRANIQFYCLKLIWINSLIGIIEKNIFLAILQNKTSKLSKIGTNFLGNKTQFLVTLKIWVLEKWYSGYSDILRYYRKCKNTSFTTSGQTLELWTLLGWTAITIGFAFTSASLQGVSNVICR